MKLSPVGYITNTLSSGTGSSCSSPSKMRAIGQIFWSALSPLFQGIKTYPICALGAVVLSTYAVYVLSSSTKRTMKESFRLLHTAVLNGEDITTLVNQDKNFFVLKKFIKHFVKLEQTTLKGVNHKARLSHTLIYQALHVLFGIKPALIIPPIWISQDTFNQIEQLCVLNPSCTTGKLTDCHGIEYYCFFNEKPTPQFDPKKYILEEHFALFGNNIRRATICCFYSNHTESPFYDQFLSYLLGYGPWEGYYHQSYPKQDIQPVSILSEEHYKELGIACGKQSLEEQVKTGREYSSSLLNRNEPFNKKTEGMDRIMTDLFMEGIIDKTGSNTPYFKAAVHFRWNIHLAFTKLFKQQGLKLFWPEISQASIDEELS